MALVVQKYGGSSVANADRIKNVASRIARKRADGSEVVAVVSAMGDTTDELIALAAQLTDRPEPREMDVLLSTGETVSSALMVMALHALGVDAISLSGAQAGMRTSSVHRNARILGIEPKRVREEVDRGRVVIVAGFQGMTEGEDVATIGRGGSDTTAVAFAAALHATCESYTDVEGVYTADPRIEPNARKLKDITYEEMLELASKGAKVMAPRAVELGAVYNIPILVASSFKDAPGTADPRRHRHGAIQPRPRHRPRPRRREDHAPRRAGPARHRRLRLRAAGGRTPLRRRHRPEREH